MQRQRFGREGTEFGRGLGFFDAIFGFAITLLVANIDMPPAEAWSSLSALWSGDLGVQLTGFVISFVVIGAFWKVNTDLISKISGMDSAVIAANLVTAALIVLIPFTTQGISDPRVSDLPLPVALYAVNVAAAIASQFVMFEIARSRGLVTEVLSRRALLVSRLDVLTKVGVFVLSIAVAYLVGPSWAMLCWALLIVVGPAMGRWQQRVNVPAVA
ncbi:MAG: DUF1211 domain-containing protein [Leucobacter sp.]|jgi:uncharacterized membrane protein|nr:DUF1211 domain-containing protein [Leucobacter sp.]